MAVIRIVELTGFLTRKQQTATSKALHALWPELTITVRSRPVRKRRSQTKAKVTVLQGVVAPVKRTRRRRSKPQAEVTLQ